jgi:hypothetical protein
MSATNRGEERYELDDYPTPEWCVHRLLDCAELMPNLVGDRWLEPCAGEGSIIKAHRSHYRSSRQIKWTANEFQEKYSTPLVTVVGPTRVFNSDIRKWGPADGKWDVYITNPPFEIAMDVLRVGMHVADHVIILQRLNWLGSKDRHPFWSMYMPSYIYVIPDRPAFRVSKKTGKVGTDATEYAWFRWDRDEITHLYRSQEPARLVMLPLTNTDVLSEDRKRIQTLHDGRIVTAA